MAAEMARSRESAAAEIGAARRRADEAEAVAGSIATGLAVVFESAVAANVANERAAARAGARCTAFEVRFTAVIRKDMDRHAALRCHFSAITNLVAHAILSRVHALLSVTSFVLRTQNKFAKTKAELAQARESAVVQIGAAEKRADEAEAAAAVLANGLAVVVKGAVAAAAAHKRAAAEADAVIQDLLVRNEPYTYSHAQQATARPDRCCGQAGACNWCPDVRRCKALLR